MEYSGQISRVLSDDQCKLEVFLSEINDYIGRSYGFDVDSEISVDALNTGNLMRFANHADPWYANCTTKICFARGSYRAVLVSKRPIEENEELTFDYGFSPEISWVKGYNEKFVEPFWKAGGLTR